MQSLLVDVNTAAIHYRRKCLEYLSGKEYANCFGSIKALNALLPADEEEGKTYRIRFDTDEYNKIVTGDTMIQCYHCKKDSNRSKIEVYNIRLDYTTAILTGYSEEPIWVCKLCKNDCILKDSLVMQNVIAQPHYSQVLPEPPEKKIGLLDQIEYHKRVVEWVWLCLDNLEESFTRYRKDYVPKSAEADLYDLNDIDTSLEDEA